MNKEEMIKMEFELMIKNNPDEALKELIAQDRLIDELKNEIDKVVKYINENGIIDINGYEILNIFRGSNNE